jgi:hypothetical protein
VVGLVSALDGAEWAVGGGGGTENKARS